MEPSKMRLSDFGLLQALKKDTNSPCTTLTGAYKGQNVFIKIFGYPDYAPTSNLYHGLEGLFYEAMFYKNYVPKLKQHCPHFLDYVNFKVKKVSFLLKLYQQNKISYKTYADLIAFPKVCILILQNLEEFLTLNNLLQKRFLTLQDHKNIKFQIFFAISCLQKIRAVHNDLHSDNIAVLKTKKRTLYYFFEDKIYKLESQYMIFIFDFDFLYCEELGYNKNLEKYDDMYIRNCFSEKNDLYTLLLYAYPSLLKELNLPGELIYEKEHAVCSEISEDMYIEIKNTDPYIISNHGVNIYKLNYGLINKYFNQPEITFLLVSLKRKRGKCYMVPFSPHEYRMTCIDSRYPTPSSLINYHVREFIVSSYPDDELIFTLPEEKPHIIHIDETLAKRGRFVLEELGIKPRFPFQKTGYVKIRTKI